MAYKIKEISSYAKKVLYCAGALSLLLVITYSYLVHVAVASASERAIIEEKASEIASEIARLEYKYIRLQEELSVEKAHEFGLASPEKELYVSLGKNKELTYQYPNER